MSRIRRIEISNFRGIESLDWFPAGGINCLIGPGDVGKSTVLDAIDLCLGRRRNVQFSDADFFKLDTSNPVDLRITVGELEDELKRLDSYGLYLRGLRSETHEMRPEPEAGAETVLTVGLMVGPELEPEWLLYSEHPEEAHVDRGCRIFQNLWRTRGVGIAGRFDSGDMDADVRVLPTGRLENRFTGTHPQVVHAPMNLDIDPLLAEIGYPLDSVRRVSSLRYIHYGVLPKVRTLFEGKGGTQNEQHVLHHL